MENYRIGIGCGVAGGLSLEVMDSALRSGIRYFDTSTFYAVGAVNQLESHLEALNIKREDVHLSMKLWVTEFGQNRKNDYDAAGWSLPATVQYIEQKFNCKRFDSLVIHFPLKVDPEGYPDEFIIEEIWPQLELLVDRGIVGEIGVSNFNIVEMQRLLNIARIKPCSNQIEFNPFAYNMDLVEFCQKQGIKAIGHTPFSFGWTNGHLALFEDETIKGLATRYNVPPAQIVLSWIISKGVMPIPGTTKTEHLQDFVDAEKLDVLTSEDIKAIDGLNKNAYHYLDIYNYFGVNFQQRYFRDTEDLHALTYESDGTFKKTSLFDENFMAIVKEALTDGAGFAVLPGIWAKNAAALQENVISKNLSVAGRWNGMGPGIANIINSGPEVLSMVDDPFLSLVIESLLGWDCKLDNITLSTSRPAPDNGIFGPHQDSPFDNNPGAPLPPPSYPMVLQVIVSLDEFREDNGPLYVIPYSHKKRSRVIVPWQGNLPFGQIPAGAVKVIVPKGSAVIAVGHVWHGSYSNESDAARMGMLMEYVVSVCDARDKFTAEMVSEDLLKHCSRRVVRLLGNGKKHQHDTPTILNAYLAGKGDAIPDFAVRKL